MSAMEPTPATPGTGDPNAATSPLEADFASAQEVQSLDSAAGAHAYGEIMQSPLADEASCRVKEQAIYALTHIYADEKAFDSILAVLSVANALFELIPKAKTAKIVRTILEIVSQVPDAIDLQVQLCNQIVEWCVFRRGAPAAPAHARTHAHTHTHDTRRTSHPPPLLASPPPPSPPRCVSQKRSFLRQRVQTRLVVLLFKQHKYQDALSLCTSLLRELKKLDDKSMLVETHLAEAHVHHALRNLPKAKAASTAARSASNAIYVVPLLQAELDKMSGTLQCEEGDYTTSYSYFLEAFEAFNAQAEPANDRDAGPSGNSYRTAALCLKYMMLCQILAGTESDVHAIVAGKHGIRYAGPDLEAMLAIAAAAKDRSLKAFDAAIAKFGSVLSDDMLIKHHLAKL